MATALAQARWRAKVAAQGRCSKCGRRRLTPRLCALCLAVSLAYRLGDLPHDVRSHAWWLEQSHDPSSRCVASGLTGAELEAIGDELTVDRKDSDLGYVRGNMQLLSRRLNRAKWRAAAPPWWEVERLQRMHAGEQVRDF